MGPKRFYMDVYLVKAGIKRVEFPVCGVVVIFSNHRRYAKGWPPTAQHYAKINTCKI